MKVPNDLFREQRRVNVERLHSIFDGDPMTELLARHCEPPCDPKEKVTADSKDVVVHKQVAVMLKTKRSIKMLENAAKC